MRARRARNSPPWRRPSPSMPWPTPADRCHSTGTSSAASVSVAWNSAWTGMRSSRSPWMSRTGGRDLISAASDLRIGIGRQDQQARNSRRSATGAAARRSPTCSAIMVPWLKPTSASAVGGRLRRPSSASRKRSRTGAAVLAPVQRSFGSRMASGNHCRPVGACAAGIGRVRRHEGGVRQQRLPGAADIDEVVAVGAIAMQEDDELARGAARLRLQPRTVELSRHWRFPVSCSA